MKKHKKKGRKRFFRKWVIKRLRKIRFWLIMAVVIGVLLGVIVLGIGMTVEKAERPILTFTILKESEQQVADMSAAERAEATLLASGLAIIGLAISVWAGLNIINAIERREINEINEHIIKLKKTSRKLTHSMTGSYQIYKRVFIQELMKCNRDAAAKYFICEFEEKESKEIFMDLVDIEQRFYEIYTLHTRGDGESALIISRTQAACEKIGEVKKHLGNKGDDLIKLYLDYRETVFIFYQSYRIPVIQRYSQFREAADNFLKYAPQFGLQLPVCDENANGIPDYPGEENTLSCAIFFVNSIGECYSKIVEQYKGVINEQLRDGRIITKSMLEYCKQQALFYCGCAVKWEAGNGNPREVYFRNYACLLERCDRIEGGGDIKNMTFTHKDEILKNHVKAVKYMLADRTVPEGRIYKVYSASLSYFERYSKRYLLGHDKEIFKVGFKEIEDIQRIKEFLQANFMEKLFDFVMLYQNIVELARKHMPGERVFYCFEGYLYTYIILLILIEEERICGMYGKDTDMYLSRIKKTLKFMEEMEFEQDDYYKDLKSRCTALENYRKES